MRSAGAPALASILVLLLAGAGWADDLYAFRSEPGRFKIGFPGELPRSTALSGEKFNTTDNDEHHVVEIEDARFSVELHDIPRAASLLLTDDFVLEQAAKGLLDDMGAQPIESASASRQDHPARWVSFEIPERHVRGDVMIVLADRRLYLVSARHPVERDPPISFGKFLESFRFWLE